MAALLPTARVAHLGPAGLTIALAMAPAIVTVARGGTDVSTALIVASLVAGAVLGWAAEDPAADLLAPMPVSSPMRAALRMAWVAAVAAIGVAAGGLIVALGPGLPVDRGDRLPEAMAAAALSLAIGFVLARRGERGAGAAAVTAGVLGTAFVAALAFRWPTVLPSFMAGPLHDRWWIIAASAAVVAARASRDPGRR